MSSKKPKLSVIENTKNGNSDGRRKRSESSREKILKAMWELMLEGDMDPSAADIAERAQVGLRSVFRHFEDLDTLYRELLLVAEADVTPKLMKPFQSKYWKEQLIELVDRTADIWDRLRVPHTAGELRRFKSVILMDDYKRSRLKELASIKAVLPKTIQDYDLVLLSLDNVLCFSTVRRLREDRKLSLRKTKEVMVHMVHTLIDPLRDE